MIAPIQFFNREGIGQCHATQDEDGECLELHVEGKDINFVRGHSYTMPSFKK